MLEVSQFTTEYAITRPLDLSLQSGESVALVGPNGSGKTTLLKSIAGQLNVVSGYISVDGITIQTAHATRRFGPSYVGRIVKQPQEGRVHGASHVLDLA